MRITKQSWWQNLTGSIIGFDGEEGAGEGAGEGAPNEGAGEGAGEGQGSQGTGGEGEGAGDDTAGLKSALQKERADRKTMEKELKALRKAQQEREDAEKTEVQRATESESKTAEKVTKLAAKIRTNAVNQAILAAAGKEKFLDPSDALRPDVISAIMVEQDEDDPSEVTIDEASVTAAIKKLAKEKPHWLQGDQKKTTKPKSGSTFGGSGAGQQGDSAKAALLSKYPALQGKIR